MEKFKVFAEREYSMRQKMAALVLEGILFVIVGPFLLIRASFYLDNAFQISLFSCRLNPLVGSFLIGPGILIALWSIRAQVILGKGTPAPLMATQNLVVQPPYLYCRNPMTLGTLLFYLGISIWIGSFSAVGLTLLFAGLLIIT